LVGAFHGDFAVAELEDAGGEKASLEDPDSGGWRGGIVVVSKGIAEAFELLGVIPREEPVSRVVPHGGGNGNVA